MKITKKINNNVALAQDAKGRELIVFGKGVGFPATPYELTDLSRVQRTFYDVDEKYFDLLRDVPQEVFLAADDAPGIPPGICPCGAGHRVPGKKLSLALYQRRAAVSAHAYPPRTGRAGRRRGINKKRIVTRTWFAGRHPANRVRTLLIGRTGGTGCIFLVYPPPGARGRRVI